MTENQTAHMNHATFSQSHSNQTDLIKFPQRKGSTWLQTQGATSNKCRQCVHLIKKLYISKCTTNYKFGQCPLKFWVWANLVESCLSYYFLDQTSSKNNLTFQSEGFQLWNYCFNQILKAFFHLKEKLPCESHNLICFQHHKDQNCIE